jgi:5'-nucleotidase
MTTTIETGSVTERPAPKKVLYVDMDNTLVDFQSGVDRLSPEIRDEYQDHLDHVPGIFALMDPLPGALAAFRELAELFDTYILSTAPWENPSAWTDKLLWVKKYIGGDEDSPAYKRLILSHHKNLNRGDFIIDDREVHGVKEFKGEHIFFTQPSYEDWNVVMKYMRTLA